MACTKITKAKFYELCREIAQRLHSDTDCDRFNTFAVSYFGQEVNGDGSYTELDIDGGLFWSRGYHESGNDPAQLKVVYPALVVSPRSVTPLGGDAKREVFTVVVYVQETCPACPEYCKRSSVQCQETAQRIAFEVMQKLRTIRKSSGGNYAFSEDFASGDSQFDSTGVTVQNTIQPFRSGLANIWGSAFDVTVTQCVEAPALDDSLRSVPKFAETDCETC